MGIRKLLENLKLSKDYFYQGTFTDLEERLEQVKHMKCNFSYRRINKLKYNFKAKLSLGILMTKGFSPVEGININAIIVIEEENCQRIKFSSSIRPEHYFILIVFIFIGSVLLSTQAFSISFLGFLVLWIVVHAWFHYILRMQEEEVMISVVKKLGLKK